MTEQVKNYEEAKVIIKNSINDDFSKSQHKAAKLRMLFGSVVSLGAIVGAGLATGSALVAGALVPVCGLINLPFIVTLLLQNKTKKEIQNGTYIERLSEEEAINIANKYSSEKEAFDSSRQR